MWVKLFDFTYDPTSLSTTSKNVLNLETKLSQKFMRHTKLATDAPHMYTYVSRIPTDEQYCSVFQKTAFAYSSRTWSFISFTSLQWRQNEHDGITNHRRLDCSLYRLFRRKWKKTSKLRVIGLCEGNSPVTGEFPAQRPVTQKMLLTSCVFVWTSFNQVHNYRRNTHFICGITISI